MAREFLNVFATLAIAASVSQPARAEMRLGPVSLESEVSVVSDYRFRGYSLSSNDPALQVGVTASLDNGLYAYAWGSSIDEYGAGADGKGATVELDYVLGWAGQAGGLDLDLSVQAYTYPGGEDVDYIEIPVSASRVFGDWRGWVGAAYAPSQKALGHKDNTYVWTGVDWTREGAPFQIELRAGYEDGAYAPGGKWDWSAGLSHEFGPIKAGLSYVDSDRAGATGVVSLTAAF